MLEYSIDGIRDAKRELVTRVDAWPSLVAGFLIGKVGRGALIAERAKILKLLDLIIGAGDKVGLKTPRAVWTRPREVFETATAWINHKTEVTQ